MNNDKTNKVGNNIKHVQINGSESESSNYYSGEEPTTENVTALVTAEEGEPSSSEEEMGNMSGADGDTIVSQEPAVKESIRVISDAIHITGLNDYYNAIGCLRTKMIGKTKGNDIPFLDFLSTLGKKNPLDDPSVMSFGLAYSKDLTQEVMEVEKELLQTRQAGQVKTKEDKQKRRVVEAGKWNSMVADTVSQWAQKMSGSGIDSHTLAAGAELLKDSLKSPEVEASAKVMKGPSTVRTVQRRLRFIEETLLKGMDDKVPIKRTLFKLRHLGLNSLDAGNMCLTLIKAKVQKGVEDVIMNATEWRDLDSSTLEKWFEYLVYKDSGLIPLVREDDSLEFRLAFDLSFKLRNLSNMVVSGARAILNSVLGWLGFKSYGIETFQQLSEFVRTLECESETVLDDTKKGLTEVAKNVIESKTVYFADEWNRPTDEDVNKVHRLILNGKIEIVADSMSKFSKLEQDILSTVHEKLLDESLSTLPYSLLVKGVDVKMDEAGQVKKIRLSCGIRFRVKGGMEKESEIDEKSGETSEPKAVKLRIPDHAFDRIICEDSYVPKIESELYCESFRAGFTQYQTNNEKTQNVVIGCPIINTVQWVHTRPLFSDDEADEIPVAKQVKEWAHKDGYREVDIMSENVFDHFLEGDKFEAHYKEGQFVFDINWRGLGLFVEEYGTIGSTLQTFIRLGRQEISKRGNEVFCRDRQVRGFVLNENAEGDRMNVELGDKYYLASKKVVDGELIAASNLNEMEFHSTSKMNFSEWNGEAFARLRRSIAQRTGINATETKGAVEQGVGPWIRFLLDMIGKQDILYGRASGYLRFKEIKEPSNINAKMKIYGNIEDRPVDEKDWDSFKFESELCAQLRKDVPFTGGIQRDYLEEYKTGQHKSELFRRVKYPNVKCHEMGKVDEKLRWIRSNFNHDEEVFHMDYIARFTTLGNYVNLITLNTNKFDVADLNNNSGRVSFEDHKVVLITKEMLSDAVLLGKWLYYNVSGSYQTYIGDGMIREGVQRIYLDREDEPRPLLLVISDDLSVTNGRSSRMSIGKNAVLPTWMNVNVELDLSAVPQHEDTWEYVNLFPMVHWSMLMRQESWGRTSIIFNEMREHYGDLNSKKVCELISFGTSTSQFGEVQYLPSTKQPNYVLDTREASRGDNKLIDWEIDGLRRLSSTGMCYSYKVGRDVKKGLVIGSPEPQIEITIGLKKGFLKTERNDKTASMIMKIFNNYSRVSELLNGNVIKTRELNWDNHCYIMHQAFSAGSSVLGEGFTRLSKDQMNRQIALRVIEKYAHSYTAGDGDGLSLTVDKSGGRISTRPSGHKLGGKFHEKYGGRLVPVRYSGYRWRKEVRDISEDFSGKPKDIAQIEKDDWLKNRCIKELKIRIGKSTYFYFGRNQRDGKFTDGDDYYKDLDRMDRLHCYTDSSYSRLGRLELMDNIEGDIVDQVENIFITRSELHAQGIHTDQDMVVGLNLPRSESWIKKGSSRNFSVVFRRAEISGDDEGSLVISKSQQLVSVKSSKYGLKGLGEEFELLDENPEDTFSAFLNVSGLPSKPETK
jgi:hypothetical protein